jgi:glycosyltransferase involved in cell wall biosynthesis
MGSEAIPDFGDRGPVPRAVRVGWSRRKQAMTPSTLGHSLRPIRIVAIGYERHPSIRLRVEQYGAALREDGFELTTLLLPQTGQKRWREHAQMVWRRVERADVVIVQRVLFRWLNLILRAAQKPVVFDLDDSVQYVRPTQLSTTLHPRTANDRGRVLYRRAVRGSVYYSSRKRLLDNMLSFCHAAILGNDVLREELAPRTRAPIVIIPTSVPTSLENVKEHDPHSPVTVGWVGTRSNLLHLRTLEPAFRSLAKGSADLLKLHVVTSEDYRSEYLPTENTTWTLEGEAEAVRSFDIGLMPLVDDPFSRGKSAFKAVLCMSYGIPVVISPVGVNAELVRNGWNGFLASTPEEWTGAISALAEDHELRARLGLNAFRTIEDRFSTERAYPRLRSLLEQVACGRPVEDESVTRSAGTPG